LIALTCSYKHPTRSQRIAGYLLHNTGSSDEASALAYYQKNDHGVTPHFVIGRSGDAYSLVPIDKVAYHLKVSSAQAKAYAERWPKEADVSGDDEEVGGEECGDWTRVKADG
jgi:N-acetyl-anhydromuramyl-L-alanine amidase AmpD